MVILVTGSSGTVGTALMMELNRLGIKAKGLDIKPSLWDKKLNHQTVHHDLRKKLPKEIIKKKSEPIDIIVHLAANARVHDSVITPKLALDNYLMSYNVLEFARKNKIQRVLFTSSREIYGESTTGRKRIETDTNVTQMKSPYTATKFGIEALFAAYSECYGIKTVITRLSNVYGRYDISERVIPLFFYYALRNRDLVVFGKNKKLDFTYIDDCVDGLLRIIKRFDKVSGRTFNICRGRGETLLSMAKSIVGLTGADSRISCSSIRTGEISSFVGDITLATKHLGFKPKITLEDGLPESLKWYCHAIKERRIYLTQRRNLAKRGWA